MMADILQFNCIFICESTLKRLTWLPIYELYKKREKQVRNLSIFKPGLHV